MTTASFALGTPPSALQRGADCRARDLTLNRNVYGLHRFASVSDCRIGNGMLRATVQNTSIPTLLVDAYRPAVTIDDFLSDTLSNTLDGVISAPAWISLGTVLIQSTTATAALTDVRLVRVTPQSVTIRLVVAAIGDAFVTLRRGERMLRIQHGSTRLGVTCTRRVRTGASLNRLVGPSRAEEAFPATAGLTRFIASHDPVTAGTFNLTTPTSVLSASFAFGVGIDLPDERVADLHSQLADSSRPQLVVI